MAALRLLQFTDTHLFASKGGTLRGVPTFDTLTRTLTAARADIAASDVILVTGDIVQDDPGGYALFRELFASLGKPIWCLPGNHDIPDAMRSALSAAPFHICGQIETHGWRIILLDSYLAHSAGGRLSAAELRRLDRSLASAANLPVLVCVHHQPVPMRSAWLDSVGLENDREFLAVIDRHPGVVRGVLWGHVHQAYDGMHGTVRLMATPSTCSQFLPGSEHFAIDDQPPAYRRLLLGAQGQIDTELVWL